MNLLKIQSLRSFVVEESGIDVDLVVVLPELLVVDGDLVRHYYLTH